MPDIREGTVLLQPSAERRAQSRMADYMRWLAERKRLQLDSYQALWQWSVTEIEAFWASLWEYFAIAASAPYTRVLDARTMPGARWFEGARLNYAEHAFRHASPAHPAIVALSEARPRQEVSWATLHADVASVAAALREMGVERGDRVVSCMPNIPETITAFLACASLGAVWSSCSPDMGAGAVTDRFKQIAPKVMFAVDGYRYGGKDFDRRPVIEELERVMPTLEHVVLLPFLDARANAGSLRHGCLWPSLLGRVAPLAFEQVDFEHPLWIVYSSGTSGLPKAIVHGHGGIVLEHIKTMALHMDLRPGDRLCWMTTTGWIMWNLLVGALLGGVTAVLFDGNPLHPDANTLWRVVAETRTDCFGAGAAFFNTCMKAELEPGKAFDLSRLRQIGSTGSPLTVENFAWIYRAVKPDVWVASISGGTDPAAGFVGGCPLLPVTAGEMQCRFLGVAVHAFDDAGQPVTDEVGELVVTEPFPTMPLYFWNDPGGRRYRESYFEMFPGTWRHGDWIRFTRDGRSVIFGRSDTTINRAGIRMGTSEIYRAVEDVPEVLDSLVVDLEYLGRESHMPLFVVLKPGVTLDDALTARIKDGIRRRTSARYVPDAVFAVTDIPRTLTGKKMELPVRKLLLGHPLAKVASPDAMANPASLAFFVELARTLNR
ncbi:MAG: acetoacetate--CoA ligase [Candidatus Rokubacteria bacterium RIFCSPLOWO2_12_FULL_71_22]|nr:MAG: acetoacetate--CoA ligase [Candidatus Rokubacteria bacterium RIFCSPLOWO2_12_FULL_71_22]